jgi:hypothetical protein
LLVPLTSVEASALSAALREATVQAAMDFTKVGPAVAGAVSAQAVALAQGVLQAMFLTRIKLAALAVAVLGALFTVAGLFMHHVSAGEATEPPPAKEGAADVKKETKKVELSLHSVYQETPFAKGRLITLEGTLGGDAELTLDGNTCELGKIGSPTGCTKVAYAPHKVKLQEVVDKRIISLERHLYDLVGAPEPMRLLILQGGVYRLLLVDGKGNATRVLTLEGKRAKPSPYVKEVSFASVYLEEPFADGHALTLKGKLDGDAVLVVDRNSFTLTPFGDKDVGTLLPHSNFKVKLEQVPLDEDRFPGYQLYDLKGAPEAMRLLIDVRDGKPPRLLELKDGKVVRVLTLEPTR